MYCICSDQLPKETDSVQPPDSQDSVDTQHAVDDDRRASDILRFATESTPPPKSEDAAEVNGSAKQTRKSKRPQWLTVSIFSIFIIARKNRILLWHIIACFVLKMPLNSNQSSCNGKRLQICLMNESRLTLLFLTTGIPLLLYTCVLNSG